jgi:DNA-binding response OmpR family regulator
MDSQQPRTVLVVEDDERTCAFLVDNLAADGFKAVGASSAEEAIRALEVRQPSLVLLDLVLGDGSGLAVLDRIRSADGLASRVDPDLPVIVLSGRSGESDRVRGLVRGADDYVCKPFSYAELIARVRAVLKRSTRRTRRGVLRAGDLVLDPVSRNVTLAGEPLELSGKEFALLQELAGDPTRVFTRAELLRDVWGYLSAGNTRTLDAHACRLRKKLGASPRRWVINVRGVGYRLTDAL